jgi:hypothetical protein
MSPLLAFVVSVVVTSGPVSSPRQPEYPHVRATDPRIARLIQETVRRSPTFARLHEALQRTDVILFVEPSSTIRKSLRGQLLFVEATPFARYLRAEIRADLPRGDLIATIAHEMQHALEIGQSEAVRNGEDVEKLYRRIGSSPRDHDYDSDLAYAVGVRVRAEAT